MDNEKVLKKRSSLNKFSFENQLFTASKEGNNNNIQELFITRPQLKNEYLNKRNHKGETPVFVAAINEQWDTVEFLLQNNANPIIKNHKKESLLSLVIYHPTQSLALTKKIIPYYSNQILNNECKILPSNTHIIHITEDYHIPAKEFIDAVIKGEKNVNNIDHNHCTALHMACYLPDIPYIMKLLKLNANFLAKNGAQQTPCDCLKKHSAAFFAIREALNRDYQPHLALIIPLMQKNQLSMNIIIRAMIHFMRENQLPNDIIRIIAHNIVLLWLPKSTLDNAEKFLWLPVCEQACKLKNVNPINTNKCLEYVMALSPEERTELNKQLLFNTI